MAIDTTKPSYWLNWRFLLCALYVLATVVIASIVIWKYEGKTTLDDETREGQQVPVGVLYQDEGWKTCAEGIHPAWLLCFRLFAVIALLSLIVGNSIIDGPGIFFFYTQWTFLLTTIFFGLASAFSIYGCWYHGVACLKGAQHIDEEQGSCPAPEPGGSMVYLLQIIYQVTAGAVVLTDVVWWVIIYPFLTAKDYKLQFFDVCMHSVNALVLVDTILNGMRFPMFRITYFILWTTLFVICQWIIHACISIPWPYPFMELSSSFAPLWYLGVGLLHIPCYGLFAVIVKVKYLGVGLLHIPCYGLFAVIVKVKYMWLPDPFQTPIRV